MPGIKYHIPLTRKKTVHFDKENICILVPIRNLFFEEIPEGGTMLFCKDQGIYSQIEVIENLNEIMGLINKLVD